MKWQAALAIAFGVSSLTLLPVHAQRTSAKTPTLTPLDIIEIQQLAIRYAYGLDTAADNGSDRAQQR